MLRLINWQLDEEAARDCANIVGFLETKSAPRLQETTLGFDCTLLCTVTDKNFGPPMKLDVLKTNPARRLYERLGFTAIAETAHLFEMQLKS